MIPKSILNPYWKHDCDRCRYLGKYNGAGGVKFDLYVCTSSLLARIGDEPSEYMSCDFELTARHPALVEAKARVTGDRP